MSRTDQAECLTKRYGASRTAIRVGAIRSCNAQVDGNGARTRRAEHGQGQRRIHGPQAMLEVRQVLGLRHRDTAQRTPHDHADRPWRFIWQPQARVFDRHTGSDNGKLGKTIETFGLLAIEIVCHIDVDFCGHTGTIRRGIEARQTTDC